MHQRLWSEWIVVPAPEVGLVQVIYLFGPERFICFGKVSISLPCTPFRLRILCESWSVDHLRIIPVH
jgi:hypothetical protein